MKEIITLQPGDKVPAFSASDQYGNKITAASMKGKWYVLYFYPNDDTETCTKEACNLRDNHAALLKAGITVIGVSHAPVESKLKFTKKYNLPFILLADTDLKICKSFGVYGDKLFMGKVITTIHRITFLINDKGRIEHVISNDKSGQAASQILDLMKK